MIAENALLEIFMQHVKEKDKVSMDSYISSLRLSDKDLLLIVMDLNAEHSFVVPDIELGWLKRLKIEDFFRLINTANKEN